MEDTAAFQATSHNGRDTYRKPGAAFHEMALSLQTEPREGVTAQSPTQPVLWPEQSQPA